MQQRNAALVHGNALKLGLFGANCSSGRTYVTLAERWDASWENNVRLAQLGDEIGIECMIPIARWKGYGGTSNPNGSNFESIAWACGFTRWYNEADAKLWEQTFQRGLYGRVALATPRPSAVSHARAVADQQAQTRNRA